MCIMCGCVDCTGQAAANGDGYVLINTGSMSSIPNNNLKWGDDQLGTASDEITWSFAIAGLTYNTTLFDAQDFFDAAQAAFDAWAAVANLTFTYFDGDANIDITTDVLPGSTVGLASYSFNTGNGSSGSVAEITAATIDMDLQPTWSPNGENGDLSYYAVLLHEIGHTLGLDHVEGSPQIMNSTISVDDLREGDIAGIRELYGPRFSGTSGNDDEDFSGEANGLSYFAFAGNDTVIGTAFDDDIYGGAGDDSLSGGNGADLLVDTLGTNGISGGNQNDTIVGGLGVTNATGDGGNDVLIGGIRGDTLDGGAGNDVLRGDPAGGFMFGNDTLIAGTDDDMLEGGGGADTFVFVTSGGTNQIGRLSISGSSASVIGDDFELGVDKIDLSDFGYSGRGDLNALLSTSGGNAIFSDQGTTITIYGVTAAELTAEEFIFDV